MDPHTGISWSSGCGGGLGRLVVRGGSGSHGCWSSSSCSSGFGLSGLGLFVALEEALELALQVGDRIGSYERGQLVRSGGGARHVVGERREIRGEV